MGVELAEDRVPDDGRLPVVWFVVPCYNEEAVLPESIRLFSRQFDALVDASKMSPASRILFVDDGSADATWRLVSECAETDPRFIGMSLSRNFGHQSAVLAGLMEARGRCDAAISIDCDGQDDPAASERMIDAFREGADVVYGVRGDRSSDTAFKRVTAESFYRFMKRMGAEVVFNHADYRLMSARALDGLAEFDEVNLFLRGLVPLIGYPSATVEYERSERAAGESHYTLGKMIGLAVDGITSLSVRPMRIIMALGFVFFALGVVVAIWAVVTALMGNAVAGWASTVCFLSVIGGLQLLALGVIGEYVGKIYLEVKRRPRYLVAERTFER